MRLHGIDAPEKGQKCQSSNGGEWACWLLATTHLTDLVDGKSIVCEGRERDNYGRLIAVCHADEPELNAEMIRSG